MRHSRVSLVHAVPTPAPCDERVLAVPRKPSFAENEHPEVGEQLRTAAERLGLSQNQVSKLSGVSRRHVGVAFKGGNISLTQLKKLVKALKLESISLGELDIAAERQTLNPHLIEHARTLVEQIENLSRDANELLRAGTSTEHAGRLMRQMASGGRKPRSRKQRAS
jgi:transcriptional regulator with XRE-family HTH domain